MSWRNIEQIVAENPPSQREARQVFDYLARGTKARFYADEDFPLFAVSILRGMKAKVITASEAGLLGHPDENHLSYALRNGLIFLTCDRDFLNERRFPLVHCPAIFVFNFGSGSPQEVRQSFRCLEAALKMPQFFDKWWKIEAKRDCWIESVRYQDGSTSRRRMRVAGQGSRVDW